MNGWVVGVRNTLVKASPDSEGEDCYEPLWNYS
jgi:hypothetical protein